MTGDTVECFNCGRPNPGWAQVCRSCGVPIVSGRSASTPTGPFPTDQASLLSMGGAAAAIIAAVAIGFIVSNMSPTEPTVGLATPSPSPRASIFIRPSASAVASGAPVGTATPVPTPPLPGTVTFGTSLNADNTVVEPTNTFTPESRAFVHSIAFAEPYGADTVTEEIALVAADGTETIVEGRDAGALQADPKATVLGYAATIGAVYDAWGTGTFVMRIYRGDEKVAEGTFTLNP